MKLILSVSVVLFLLSCQKEKIITEGIIKDHFYFENKGATMQVFLEGNISSKKILIMIHGGPGDGSLYFNTPEATEIAEKEFAIAYWDQRLAGSSQGTMLDHRLNCYTEDLKKLIAILHYRYGASQKIYALGHSWGGLIAPLFIKEGTNQQLLSGWIQVDGVHNYPMNDSLTRNSLIQFGEQEILANRNTSKWEEIVNYCKSKDPKNNMEVARKINKYANSTDPLIEDVIKGNNMMHEINYFIREYDYPITTFPINKVVNLKNVEEQAYQENISEKLNAFNLPILLLWGKYDFVCPIGLANDIKNNCNSKDITTKIFNNSGHSPMFSEPVAFWNSVASWVMMH